MLSGLRLALRPYLAVAIILASTPTPKTLLAALPILLAGEALRIWATLHLRYDESLATGGPYAYCRNPIYVGSAMIGLALCLMAFSWAITVGMLLYFALTYPATIVVEETRLADLFGDQYAHYASTVPRVLPKHVPYMSSHEKPTWRLFFTNREWAIFSGLALITMSFIMKLR